MGLPMAHAGFGVKLIVVVNLFAFLAIVAGGCGVIQGVATGKWHCGWPQVDSLAETLTTIPTGCSL